MAVFRSGRELDEEEFGSEVAEESIDEPSRLCTEIGLGITSCFTTSDVETGVGLRFKQDSCNQSFDVRVLSDGNFNLKWNQGIPHTSQAMQVNIASVSVSGS